MEEKEIFEKAASAAVCRRIACILCCICLLLQAVPVPAWAAEKTGVTFSQLNDAGVFLKQSQARVCTLTSSVMMIRRAAMLSGQKDWKKITEQSVRKNGWAEGVGLKWNFTSSGITVVHKTLSSKSELIKLLDKHPEGIVIYNTRRPHAILITDYTDGVLYCSDPSNDRPAGRYPISKASITAESASRCWYVKAPAGLSVIKEEDNEKETWEEDGLTYEVLSEEDQTAACTGQAEDAASAVVPDTVKLGGVEYKVTEIAQRAFAQSAKLKEITIGAHVSSIGKKAFYQCKKLKTVNIYASNLQEIGADAFANIYKKAKIVIMADNQIERFAGLLSGTSVPGTVQIEVSRETIMGTKAGKENL